MGLFQTKMSATSARRRVLSVATQGTSLRERARPRARVHSRTRSTVPWEVSTPSSSSRVHSLSEANSRVPRKAVGEELFLQRLSKSRAQLAASSRTLRWRACRSARCRVFPRMRSCWCSRCLSWCPASKRRRSPRTRSGPTLFPCTPSPPTNGATTSWMTRRRPSSRSPLPDRACATSRKVPATATAAATPTARYAPDASSQPFPRPVVGQRVVSYLFSLRASRVPR